MNITYYTYPFAFDIPGGGERQLMAYRHYLKDTGIDVNLFNQWNPCFEECDIFHCFSVMPGVIENFEYARKKGIKTVLSPNLWITEKTKKNYPTDLIWNLFSLADRIVVNSYLEAENLSRAFSCDFDKFAVVYNGVEERFLKRVDEPIFQQTYHIPKPYFLNVANVEPRKNQLNFLKALKNYPDISLVTVGYERDRIYAEECHRVGGSQFIHINALPYGSDMLRSAICNADGFVMPSTLETPSIAALEAGASGCRLLVTSEGSTKEYFQDYVTYVDPDDVDSMSRGIEKMLSEGFDINLHLRIGWSFTWNHVVKSLVDLYKSLVS